MSKGTFKRWSVLCLFSLLALVSRAETVGIIITAVGLTDSSGAALSDNSLIQVIANTAGQTPGAPTVTSFVSGSDIVLTSFGLDSSSTGIPGSFQVYLTIDRSAFAGLNPGAPLLLRWYDIPYSSGLTAPGFSAFGQFTTNVVVDDSTSGWTLGQDGSNSSLNFINTANGGSQSSTAGAAGNMVSRNLLTLTANSGQTKVYGANDPTLTYSITSGSLVGSDVITGAPARDSGSAVGQYAITQGSLTAGNNYTITFVSNNFTITPQLLGVAANTGQGKIYGATDPSPLAYTITSGALIGSDTLSGQLQRAAGESAGNYAITQGTLAASSNYTLTYT
ncbi:MAG TPA: MBG domain-containing protein, partial [Opitutaceae bacterium]